MANLIDFRTEEASFAEDLKALLIEAGGSKRSAEVFIQLRGLGGEEPRSLRGVSNGLSAERIRQLVGELEEGALARLKTEVGPGLEMLKSSLGAALQRIEKHAPGADADIQSALAADFEPLYASPASVVRMADILGVHHGLRLTKWTARTKFADEERVKLATAADKVRRETVTGVVPIEMPEVFEHFINFSRRYSRGAGIVAAGQLAQRYADKSSVALAPNEAVAFLRPFAVHLGRHDGDDWFAFFNSANDFLRKATTRVELFGHGSFEAINEFHQRYNRSSYADENMTIPESALRALLELAGFDVQDDEIRPMAPLKGQSGRGVSGIQVLMVKVFRDLLTRSRGQKSVRRADLVQAMLAAGIRESTARVYLGNQGLFTCSGGLCRLADSSEAVEGIDPKAPRKLGRPPKVAKPLVTSAST